MSDINWKDFKKVKSDKDSTTMVNKNGHQLRIVHSALSPKMREQLAKLPAQVQKFADGSPTGVSEQSADDESDSGPQSPVTINIGNQGQPATGPTPTPQANSVGSVPQAAAPAPLPTPAQYQSGVSDPGPQATTGFNPNNPGPQAPDQTPPAGAAGAPPASNTQEDDSGAAYTGAQTGAKQAQGAVEVPAEVPTPAADIHQAVKGKMLTEDAAFQKDLDSGHIAPETYRDLFGRKDTLGKIGMIFGLLLGGAGGGLTHSPSAAMEMMNKQIANDLEAQKASKTNAYNFLNLNRERILNNAQIEQMQKQGTLTEAQAKVATADAANKSYALSRMNINRVALHHLVQVSKGLPDSQMTQQQAQQALAMMSNAVGAENYDIADKAAASSAYMGLMFGNPNSQQGDEKSFQQRTTGMKMLGAPGQERAKDLESHHIPGLQGQSSIPVTPADREAVTAGLTFQDQLKRFRDFAAKNSGSLDYSKIEEGKALSANLASAYRQASAGGVYKASEQEFINNLIDPDPTKFLNQYRVLPKLDAVVKDSQAQLNQKVKSLGFSGAKSQSESAPSGPAEGATGTYQGKPVVRRNGKWEYK